MNLLEGGAYLNLVFLLLAIISIAMSIFFYLKSKKEKKLVYLHRNFSLVSNSLTSIPDLEIEYKHERINQLTLTKISLWNAGKDTINAQDITNLDYLKVSAPLDVTFYSSSISFVSREINELSISESENEIKIDFDFLDYGDGGVINIYHSGNISSKLALTGTIKGGLKIVIGDKKEQTLTYSVANFLLPTYWDADLNDLSIIDKLFFYLLLPFGLGIAVLFGPVDIIISKFAKTIPKEYNLS